MMKLARPLVALDLETTGTWVDKDRIVEIGMLRCLPDGSQEPYRARVNPGMPIPPRVSQVIGISDADVKECPPFKELAPTVVAFLGDADLAGFNIERFDLPLLQRELFAAGMKFEWRTRPIYDAQKIYHLHEKRNLTAAYKFYCEKALVAAHTALGDAEASLEILAVQIHRYGKPDEGIASLRDFEYEQIDDYFDREGKFRWWNGELYPVFGKYARRTGLREIAKRDRPYLEWILTSDFSDEVKGMVQEALQGRFPTAPAAPPAR